MATTVAELMATLGLDASRFNKEIDQAENKGKAFGDTMAGLSAVGGGILAAGLATATAGAVVLGKELFSDMQLAADAEKVSAQLEAVLKSTGGVAGVTAEEVENLSASLSQMTAFDDEAITSGQSMLLTFTEIGEDIFPDATEAMLDMSTALGQDLKSSAIQLGKALNDPVQGVTALRRVGVNFNEEQEKMIKGMVEAGNLEEAQIFILQELQKEFGGSAKAAGETFAGRMTILKNSIDNVRESIGARLLPIAQKLIDQFVQIYNSPAFQEFLNKAVDNLVAFIDTAVSNVPLVINWFKNLVAWFSENKPIVIGILAALGVAVVAFAVTTIASLLSVIVAALPIIAIMALIGVAAYLLYRAWTENWGGIQQVFQNVVNFITAYWKMLFEKMLPVFEYFSAQIKTLTEAFHAAMSGDWELFGAKIREAWDRGWAALVSILNSVEVSITNIVRNLINKVITFFKTTDWPSVGRNILQGIVSGMNALEGWVTAQIRKLAQNIMKAFTGFFGIKSPSELMENIVGKNLALGLNEGFMSNLDLSPSAVLNDLPTIQSVSSSAFAGNNNMSNIETLLQRIAAKEGNDEQRMAFLFAQELSKVIR